jgi:hypothetical protein
LIVSGVFALGVLAGVLGHVHEEIGDIIGQQVGEELDATPCPISGPFSATCCLPGCGAGMGLLSFGV